MTTKKKVQESETFQKMNGIQQKLILSKNSFESIRHGHSMSTLTSFDNWVQKFSPANNIKSIVQDLLK